MIFFTSDDMKDGAVAFAKANPTIPVEFTSGDSAWKDGKVTSFRIVADKARDKSAKVKVRVNSEVREVSTGLAHFV